MSEPVRISSFHWVWREGVVGHEDDSSIAKDFRSQLCPHFFSSLTQGQDFYRSPSASRPSYVTFLNAAVTLRPRCVCYCNATSPLHRYSPFYGLCLVDLLTLISVELCWWRDSTYKELDEYPILLDTHVRSIYHCLVFLSSVDLRDHLAQVDKAENRQKPFLQVPLDILELLRVPYY